jgi:hypothetical protein
VQAAALVGNLSYESMAFLRAGPPRLVPSLGEVGGTGIGIAQWTYPPRKQALFAFAKKAGKPWTDFQLQLDYVVEEMRTTYAYALSRLRGARNLADATAIVENYYESPQPGSTPQRLYYARRVLSESR